MTFIRTWHGSAAAATALAGTLLLSVPPAQAAAGPIRTEIPPHAFVMPAGKGCPDFDVRAEGVHHTRIAETQFPDGRFVRNTSATVILTNLNTGQSVEQRSRYMSVGLFDPATGGVHLEVHGSFWVGFWPGDIGPDGSIVTEATLLSVVGHQTFTIDPETGAYEAYHLDGQVLFDICAALSE